MRAWLASVFDLKTVALILVLGGFFYLSQRATISETDTALPPLPIASLAGAPIAPASFAGQPWVINVWMPG